jgi:hypothetical protein
MPALFLPGAPWAILSRFFFALHRDDGCLWGLQFVARRAFMMAPAGYVVLAGVNATHRAICLHTSIMSDSAHSRAHWLRALALPATAIGFPILAVAALVGEVISSLWVAIVLVGLGELVLLFAVGMLRAWSTTQAARRPDRLLVALLRNMRHSLVFRLRYQRPYLHALRTRLCCIEVYEPPYRLRLEQVFEPPGLLFRPAHQVQPSAVRDLPQRLRGGSLPIGRYLNDPQSRRCNLVILGAAGSGKTTLLKHTALALAGGRPRPPVAAPPDVAPLPVFLCLRDMAVTIAVAPGLSLPEMIARSLGPAGPAVPPRVLEWLLRSGHALVFCDSLDELPDSPVRRSIIGWLQCCMAAYPEVRFVLALDSVEAYALRPANTLVLDMVAPRQEQVRSFVQRWYRAAEVAHAGADTPDIQVLAQQGADDLWNRLRAAPALATAASNPLLLTLAANLHYYGIPLPKRHIDLYAAMSGLLLGQRQPTRSPEAQQIADRQQRVLRTLAYEMMCRRQCEMPLAEALPVMCEAVSPIRTMLDSTACIRLLEEENGLVVRGNGTLRFAHAAFQAALAAAYMQTQPIEDMLIEWVADSWWHPVLRLYASQNDTTPLVEACLASDAPPLSMLMLAISCVEVAAQVQPAARARLEGALAASVEAADPQRRAIVSEALLAERLRQMVLIGKDVYADTTLISCAEYQLFLDEQHAGDPAHWPDHWPGGHFPAGQGRMPVLGVRASDALAFCEWLTRRDSGEWRYRLPWLGRHSHEAASGTCLVRGTRGSGYWGRTEAGLACMRTGEARPLVSSALLARRYAADVRYAAEHLRGLCRILKKAYKHACDLEHATAHPRAAELVRRLRRAYDDSDGCTWLRQVHSLPSSTLDGSHERALDLDVLRFQHLDALPVALLAAARTRALGVIHLPDVTNARDLAVGLARTLAPAAEQPARAATALAHDLDAACAQLGDLSRNLADDVAALLDRSARQTTPDLWRDELARARAVLPGWAALLACEEAPPAADAPAASALIDACLECYVALVVLEERAAGAVPPLEGICMVRERAEAST